MGNLFQVGLCCGLKGQKGNEMYTRAKMKILQESKPVQFLKKSTLYQ